MEQGIDRSSLGGFSRDITAFFGETRGRSVSAVTSDWTADLIEAFTGRRPSREAIMPWVHLGMALGTIHVASKLLSAPPTPLSRSS